MRNPLTIQLGRCTFHYHVQSATWKCHRTPWRIHHEDNRGWFAVNVSTHEELDTSTRTYRQLRATLKPLLDERKVTA